MRAAWEIARKDITLRLRDRSALIWGVLAPLGLAAVFSLILGSVTGGDSLDVRFAVVDQDDGPVATAFVDLLETLDADGVAEVESIDLIATAEERVAAGELDAAFLIPQGFSDAVGAGTPASIAVIGYVDSPIGGQVASAIAGGFVDEVNALSVAVQTRFALTGTAPGQAEVEAAVAEVSTTPSPIDLALDTRASKELDASTFYAAGMAVFFLFFTVQFGVIGLLEERSDGTLARLLAAPIPRSSIIGGKAITSFVLGVVSMAVLIVTTSLLPFMDAEWGNPLGVAVLVLAGVFSAMGVMAVVAAFARTPETAQSIQSVVAFVLGMLGGAFFPLAQAGGFVAALSRLTPHSAFLRGLGDLGAGGGIAEILPEAAAIVAFGAVAAGLAAVRLRRTVML